jgi:hypothetical protein
MANKKRGYYTLNIGGTKRTMHFSMNFWTAFTEELNVPLDKIGEVFDGGISLSGIRALIYSGLLAYDQEEGNEIDYNIFKVGTWLDDLDAAELENIVQAMLQSKILGNDLNMGIERNPKLASTGKQQPTP